MSPLSSPQIHETQQESTNPPEHAVVMLLEGGQKFLTKATVAIRVHEPLVRDHYLKRVLAILVELNKRLDPELGGELVINLSRIYNWWGREILEAGEFSDEGRLKAVSAQMGEIRRSWERVLFLGEGWSEIPDLWLDRSS